VRKVSYRKKQKEGKRKRIKGTKMAQMVSMGLAINPIRGYDKTTECWTWLEKSRGSPVRGKKGK